MAKKERTAEEVAAKAAKKAAKLAAKATASSSKKAPAKTLDEKLEENSPFVQIRTSLYLALSPSANNSPVDGLCAEHISPNLLTYFPPLNGVLLAFSNPRVHETPNEADSHASDPLAISINEYAVTFVWLTCDFLVFRPSPGTYLKGDVNLQNEGMLGLIFCNYFNVTVPRENLPENWTWNEETWVDGDGNLDNQIVCKVVDFDAGGPESISVTATLIGL